MAQTFYGNLNPAGLQLDDVYIAVQPPTSPSGAGGTQRNGGTVGAAGWGPKNTPVYCAQPQALLTAFGLPIGSGFDIVQEGSLFLNQGPNGGLWAVRVTDNTDTAATGYLTDSASAEALHLTAVYTGSYGNTIRVVLAPGSNSTSGTPTWKITLQLGSNQPETFDRVPQGSAGAVWVNFVAAINNSVTGSQYVVAALPGSPSSLAPAAAGTSVTLAGGTDGSGLDDANVPAVAATGEVTFSGTPQAAQALSVTIGGTPYSATSGSTFALSVAALVAAIGSSGDVTATTGSNPDVLYLTANTAGAAGNAITLSCVSPAGTNDLTASGATLAGGANATPNVLIGTQGGQGERTGMYCLEATATPVDAVWLCGFTDSNNWANVGSFAQSINAQGYTSFATGQTVAQVVAAKIGAELDGGGYLLIDKDWVTFYDSYLNGNYSVPPAPVVAGTACSLQPQESVGNKPVSGIIGTEATLGSNPSPYSNNDLALLESNGIGVITNPIPTGAVFGRRHGRTTSSNVATRENTYGSMTNFLVRSMGSLLGQFVNLVQSTQQNDPVRLGVSSVLNGFLGPMKTAFQITDFTVTSDLTNNTPASIAAGFLYASVKVSYMAVINYFIVNLTAGQTVSVSVAPSS